MVAHVVHVPANPVVAATAHNSFDQDVHTLGREPELGRNARRRHKIVDRKPEQGGSEPCFIERRKARPIHADLGRRRATTDYPREELLAGALRHGARVADMPGGSVDWKSVALRLPHLPSTAFKSKSNVASYGCDPACVSRVPFAFVNHPSNPANPNPGVAELNVNGVASSPNPRATTETLTSLTPVPDRPAPPPHRSRYARGTPGGSAAAHHRIRAPSCTSQRSYPSNPTPVPTAFFAAALAFAFPFFLRGFFFFTFFDFFHDDISSRTHRAGFVAFTPGGSMSVIEPCYSKTRRRY